VRRPDTEAAYVVLFNAIKAHGQRERFGKYTYRYLYLGEFKYWAMSSLPYSKIINRARV
jgi:hypothetical protein